jgi:probable rRNA maturation factor
MRVLLSEKPVSVILDLQLASDCADIPKQDDIQLWLDTLLSQQQLADKEITVRIVKTQQLMCCLFLLKYLI